MSEEQAVPLCPSCGDPVITSGCYPADRICRAAWVEGAGPALRDGAHYDTACDDRPDCRILEHHAMEDLA